MFALYFRDGEGSRAFITALDDRLAALAMARSLSRQDPRAVVVVENRSAGDTIPTATYQRGHTAPTAAPGA